MLDMPFYPSLETCSGEKQEAGWQMISFLDEAMWYGIDVYQVEPMIQRIIKHLKFTYGEKDPAEQEECRDNFRDIKEEYEDRMKSYDRTYDKKQELWKRLWKTKEKLNVTFVGNEDLIMWMVYHNYNGELPDCENLMPFEVCPSDEFSWNIVNTFIDGRPFTYDFELGTAIENLHDERVSLGLVPMPELDIRTWPSLEKCSVEIQIEGEDMINYLSYTAGYDERHSYVEELTYNIIDHLNSVYGGRDKLLI